MGHKYTANMQVSVFVNGATGITIEDVTITNGTSGTNPDAMVFWNSSTGTLNDSAVTGSYVINGVQSGQGIAVDAGSGQTTNLTVNNVAISGFQKNGIDAVDGNSGSSSSDTLTLTVTGGTITGAGATSTIAQNGIVLWNKGGGTVSGSVDGATIADLEYVPTTDNASGILVFGTASIPTISHTTFTDVQLYIGNVSGGSATDATTGNMFDGVSPASATNAELGAIEDKLSGETEDSSAEPIYIRANSTIATPTTGIKAAVDAAPSGGTVYVAPGTYNELVVVTKPLTLLGAQHGVDARTRSAASESVISNADGDLQIEADNVTIDGFTLTGVVNDPSSIISSLGAAIWTNPNTGFPAGTHGGTAVLNDIIQGNIAGLELGNDGTYQTSVRYNLFKNNTEPGSGSGNGIETDFGLTNALIDSNLFDGSQLNLNGAGNAGVTSVTVSGNEMTNVASAGIHLLDTSGVTVSGNSIHGNDLGISVDGGNTSTSISGNTIENNAGDGIDIANVYAIYGVAGNTAVSVHQNVLSGNSAGLVIEPGTYTGTLDASQNYWDSTVGPTASDNANAGTGESVSSGVTYRPWCTEDTCAGVDTTSVTVTSATALPTAAKGNAVVTITIQFNKNPMNTGGVPVVVAGFSSGTTTVTKTSYIGDTWTGTVTVPALPHKEQSVSIESAGAEDTYGNQLSGTSTPVTFESDTLAPSIVAVDVTQTGTNPSWAKIGDEIDFTVTPAKAEPGALLSPADYNSEPLSWGTTDGGNTYVGTYIVTAGDAGQASPLQLTGVTMTDAAGNTSFAAASSDVTKGIDANDPTVTLPSAVYASTTPVSTGATASDAGSGISTYVWTQTTGAGTVTFSDPSTLAPTVMADTDGDYTLQLVVTDVAGNSTTETMTLHQDSTSPTIGTNADISSQEATSASGATVSFSVPSASDANGIASETCDPASGSVFPIAGTGTTTVTCTAIDNAGNSSTSTFDVGVVDTTAPTISLIAVNGTTTVYMAVGNTFTDPGYSATDIVDGADSVTVGGSVDTSTAGSYTLTYDATDSRGNAAAEMMRDVVVEGTSFTLATSTSGTSVVATIGTESTTTASSGGITATFDIPAGTTVTGTTTWDGVLNFPTVSASFTSPTAPGGFTDTVTMAVEVGSSDALTFDKGVRIVFSGQAGNHVGWSRNGSFTEITDTCSADTQATGDALAGGDCKINVGADLVVWTEHFTTFLTYTQTANPAPVSSGGGGGGGGGIASLLGTTNGAPQSAGAVGGGQVLGAAAYNFTANLTVGSRGTDVIELQKVLMAEGDLTIAAPTGYFGALTKVAVIAYQKAHGISPTSGYVGPLTRTELNKGVVSTNVENSQGQTVSGSTNTTAGSHLSSAQVQAILNLLTTFGADASVIANVQASLGGH